jgi:multicomponent Na+:H+ antiporter subunit B
VTERARTILYVASALIGFAAFMYGAVRMEPFGSFTGPYTQRVLRDAVAQRHVYNAPTAVNFDYRGMDTLCEEFIFFTSVLGVVVFFSGSKSPTERHPEPFDDDPYDRRKTGALRWFATGVAAFIAALAMDIGGHGQLTPGGGFQGGAIFGGAFACIYLGIGVGPFLKTASQERFDPLEAFGALAFAATGVAGLIAAGAFLTNILPLGITGATVSGGTIYLLSCAVFVEIACGFAVLLAVFLKQTARGEESN